MKYQMQEEITQFFRDFAMRVLRAAQVDPNNSRAFKLAMLDHYEEIYPQFAQTRVFQENYNKSRHNEMVEEYKRCFSLLLVGRLP